MHGGLQEEYGIKELIDGFNMVQNQEIELRLYGQGNAIEYIKKAAQKNDRIKYCGVKTNEEIIIDIDKIMDIILFIVSLLFCKFKGICYICQFIL